MGLNLIWQNGFVSNFTEKYRFVFCLYARRTNNMIMLADYSLTDLAEIKKHIQIENFLRARVDKFNFGDYNATLLSFTYDGIIFLDKLVVAQEFQLALGKFAKFISVIKEKIIIVVKVGRPRRCENPGVFVTLVVSSERLLCNVKSK